jgi:lactoylglutathione lyase
MPVTLRAAFPVVYCERLRETLAFYRDLLGFEVSFAFPEEGEPAFVSLALGGSELALADVRGQEAGTHGLPVRPIGGHRFEVCLQAEDVDAAVAELRAAGVPVLVEPADQPWGERLAYVQDPEGNPVMLYAGP